MKYMMLIYGAENMWTEEERRDCMIDSLAICDRLAKQGKFLAASPLQSVSTAATVRVRNGRALVTAGPFAETTEQLGGYYLLDLEDLDEAMEVASQLPPATKGVVEIRPIFPLGGLPSEHPLPEGSGAQHAYLLLCYDDEKAWQQAGPDALRQAMDEAVALTWRLERDGKYVNASPLRPANTATTVKVRDGKRIVMDGPYAETHEVLGGFYVILADSQEEALAIAAQHSGVKVGSVEVRPLFDMTPVRKRMTVSKSAVDS